MLQTNLKKITLLQSLLYARTKLAKAKIGLKLITRSEPCEAYDLFWVLSSVVCGHSPAMASKVKKYLTDLSEGKDVKFDLRSLVEYPPNERLCIAFHLAAGGHAGQKRKGILSRPYMHHILMVWYLTALSGASLQTQIAALLHDFLEDVPDEAVKLSTLESMLKLVLGEAVLSDCQALKNKQGLSGKTPAKAKQKHTWQVKHLAKMDPRLQNLKLTDRLCNLYDCRRDGPKSNTPKSIRLELDKWDEFSAQVDDVLPLVSQLSAYIEDLLVEKYSL